MEAQERLVSLLLALSSPTAPTKLLMPAIQTSGRFPADTRLAGDSYMVVIASGTSSLTSPLHTNFKLSADPGYLALVAPDGSSVIDQINPYPGQRTDLSYGVASGGGVGYFKPPTPGASNGTAFTGFVTDTSFDIDRGFFDAPFTVKISTPTPGATIVYTTDGTEPTPSNGTATPPVDGGTPGAASVLISGTTVLRAAAFKTDFSPTDIDTQTYLFVADIVEQPEMDPDVVDAPAYSARIVPALKSVRSLSIVTDPDNLFDSMIGIPENTGGRGIEWERPVSIEFIDPDNAANSFQTNAGLRMHGNGSRGSAKNSLRLLFRAEYGAKKLEYPLFGEDWVTQKFNTVVLRAQNANSWTSGRSEDRASTNLPSGQLCQRHPGCGWGIRLPAPHSSACSSTAPTGDSTTPPSAPMDRSARSFRWRRH